MMTITDVAPANVPRVLLDGELLINKNKVPVLISAGNHRLVILQSQSIYEIQVGQEATLINDLRGNQDIVIADVDRLALVVRYEIKLVAEDDFELPSPE
jgi:hypothetical protein